MTIIFSSGVQQGGLMGPALFCLVYRRGLGRFRQGFEGKEVEVFSHMHDVAVILRRVTANTSGAFGFLARDLDSIGVVINRTKTVALAHQRHVPMVEEFSLLESVNVRIANKEQVPVVGVPIDTEKYVRVR